jgi:hypothetical protein
MNTIYCFWTGRNEMSETRKSSLEQIRKVSECNVILVTPDNLSEYILPDVPLHPSYEFLSETHKSDFLRTYFMNFHGGGYSDIKRTTGSWVQSFADLAEKEDKWIIGYQELEGGVGYGPAVNDWRSLVGNCAYICKPNTPLTNEWYNSMIKLLDERLERLRAHPAKFPQDRWMHNGSQYPIEWNEMLGRIFHRVCYGFRDRLITTLPPCIFYSYQ